MQWFYLSEKQERLGAPEEQLAMLAASGVLRPSTLVWRKGLDEWISAGEVRPELFLPAQSDSPTVARHGLSKSAEHSLVTDLASSLARFAPWLRATGLLWLAFGAISSYICALFVFIQLKGAPPTFFKDQTITAAIARILSGEIPISFYAGLFGFSAISAGGLGWLLLGGAHHATVAAKSGDPVHLSRAMENTGRYFLSVIIMTTLLLLAAVAVTLYLQRQDALPKQPDPAGGSVTI